MTYTPGIQEMFPAGLDVGIRGIVPKPQATSGTNAWGLSFGYDAWGNLLTESVTQGSAPMLNVGVGTNNRVTGFCYDAAGNLLDQGACPSTSHTYAYNAEGQMTATAGVAYAYDGDGKRVSKSNGKLYWYGMGNTALDETDLKGNLSFEYVFFGGARIARRDSSGNVAYYFADHLGTARVVTNASGAILDDSDFYPFGGERPIVSSSGNTYKFTGDERDSESSSDHTLFRQYSFLLGRWLSPDPIAGRRINPQSLNRYSYVKNNPLNATDPLGLCDLLMESADPEAASSPCSNEGGIGGQENQVITVGLVFMAGDNKLDGSALVMSDEFIATLGVAVETVDLDYLSKSTEIYGADNLRPGIDVLGNGPQCPACAFEQNSYARAVFGQVYNQTSFLEKPSFYATWFGASVAGGSLLVDAGLVGGAGEEITTLSRVYRVFGRDAPKFGQSFTPFDPRAILYYAEQAGLPIGNSAESLLIGELPLSYPVTVQGAAAINGVGGGLTEFVIANAARVLHWTTEVPF